MIATGSCAPCDQETKDALLGLLWTFIILITLGALVYRYYDVINGVLIKLKIKPKPKPWQEKYLPACCRWCTEENNDNDDFEMITKKLFRDLAKDEMQGEKKRDKQLEAHEKLVEETIGKAEAYIQYASEALGGSIFASSNKKTTINTSLTKLRIMVVYLQIISYLDITFDIPWPQAVVDFYNLFVVISVDLEALFHFFQTCFMQTPFLTAFGIHMRILPIFISLQVIATTFSFVLKLQLSKSFDVDLSKVEDEDAAEAIWDAFDNHYDLTKKYFEEKKIDDTHNTLQKKKKRNTFWKQALGHITLRTLYDYLIKDILFFVFLTYPGMTVSILHLYITSLQNETTNITTV